MFFDLLEAQRVNALFIFELIQPEEQCANIPSNNCGCLTVNQDVRVKEHPHIGLFRVPAQPCNFYALRLPDSHVFCKRIGALPRVLAGSLPERVPGAFAFA